MRRRRIKTPSEVGPAVYHCLSKTVNGERLFDDVAREVFRKQLWQVADFCGLEVLTYTILSNHFHVLVRVPQKEGVSDPELLRRYHVLYPRPTKYQVARLDALRAQLESDEPEAQAWRNRQLRLMGDVSAFMRLLKQRFTLWFNKTHSRFGPLWCDRFKSVLVEPRDRVIQTMAAYIDLNCVRAGLAEDPKDYRFCGYAEAVSGHERARGGLRIVTGETSWRAVQATYRLVVFATGSSPRSERGSLSLEAFDQVVRSGGTLPIATVLRCRLRYFNDGAVLGSQAFVAEQLARYRMSLGGGLLPRTAPRPMPNVTDWGELATLHALHRAPLR